MTIEDIIPRGTEPQELGVGYGFTEGPAADARGNVYFSDGKNDAIHFYQFGRGVSLFVGDSTDANGMMFNHQGELVVCEGAAYRIVAFDVKTRQKRVLADQFQGTHFNEPNDLAIDFQDGVYFSDPIFHHHGQPAVMKEDAYYRAPDGEVTRVSTVCQKPNGVRLTPDNKTLFLADTSGQVVYRYAVLGPGKLADETLWIEVGARPDGMTLDEHGNLYVCCGVAGVKVYSPAGELMGGISLPYASNCVFGGPDFSMLFVTSRDRFLGIPTRVRGVLPPCATPLTAGSRQ